MVAPAMKITWNSGELNFAGYLIMIEFALIIIMSTAVNCFWMYLIMFVLIKSFWPHLLRRRDGN
jgi:hypothetical protein